MATTLPPEIAFLSGRIPEDDLNAAARRATMLGLPADRVLVASGVLEEEAYARALARHLGLPFIIPATLPSPRILTPEAKWPDAAAAGVLSLTDAEGAQRLLVAPTDLSVRRLMHHLSRDPAARRRYAIGTRAGLVALATGRGAASLGTRATLGLVATRPAQSALDLPLAPGKVMLALAFLLATVLFVPGFGALLELALAFCFLAWMWLRLGGCAFADRPARPARPVADHDLPTYTVLVPLAREMRIVPQLVAELTALDWPKERLDIKFLIEADDHATRDALRRHARAACFEIITVPAVGPRTKPKALNVGLALARGRFVVVFDAEDRPEKDQLKRAFATFRCSPGDVVCIQARLTIDNTRDNWLTRLFTADYAALFDVFLPLLGALRLPVPLGGTSNHFLTSALVRAGGWDPHNVTEDLDLGVRLARDGFTTRMIASSTFEEAPQTIGRWLRQRTRWYKGWMVTWLVHTWRDPGALWRDLGATRFFAVQALTFGTVGSALVHPVAVVVVAWNAMMLAAAVETIWHAFLMGLSMTVLAVGYGGTMLIGAVGLMRRGLWSTLPWLVLSPVYWGLLSLAAWAALREVLRDPYYWSKTEHGFAETSRMNQQPPAGAAPRQPAAHK
jgi:cellulose synthase/poly-beta-1,6-N-acetylglucosamine synthase-like glycosyltransferase